MTREERKYKHVPWILRILSILLAFVLALSILGGAIQWTLLGALNHPEYYVQAGQRMRNSQLGSLHAQIHTLSEEYGFSEAAITDMITRETLDDYSGEVIEWMLQLLDRDYEAYAPLFALPDAEAVIRSDPGFLEKVDVSEQRHVAQTEIVYAIEETAQKELFPLRVQVLAMGAGMAHDNVDVEPILEKLNTTWVFPAVGGACLVLILLLCLRRITEGCLWAGSGLAAGGIMTLLTGIALKFLRLPDIVGEINPDLAVYLGKLVSIVERNPLYLSLAALILGFVLIEIYCARHELPAKEE
ncbi:MAG: hypothetical protein IJ083_10460 [Clostridia bacterium]|nr:hypothetical protein [Clostridia bacterium]